MTNNYEGKLCPIRMALMETGKNDVLASEKFVLKRIECVGRFCAWWYADKERCAVLSLARNK